MPVPDKVTFAFYSVDGFYDPDFVIDDAGRIQRQSEPERKRKWVKVLVMVGKHGPTETQLITMAQFTKGKKTSRFDIAAAPHETAVKAIGTLLPESAALPT